MDDDGAGAFAQGSTPVDHGGIGGREVVKRTTLALGTLAALGLAAKPSAAFQMAPAGSEAVSALLVGAFLLLVAAVAKGSSVREH